jgi:hypothetical protein
MKFTLISQVVECNPTVNFFFYHKIYLPQTNTWVNPTHFRLIVEMDEQGNYSVEVQTYTIGEIEISVIQHWSNETLMDAYMKGIIADCNIESITNFKDFMRDIAYNYLSTYFGDNVRLYEGHGFSIDQKNFEESFED